MKTRSKWSPPTRGRRVSAVVLAVGLLGAFGLTACQPLPVDTALQLTLTDTASSVPAANVTVSVFPAGDTGAPAAADGITDATGTVWFTHDELPGGDYVVRYGSGSSTSWYPDVASRDAATVVTVSDLDQTTISGSVAENKGYITGQVDDSTGAGLAGVTVTAYDAATGRIVGTTMSYAAGLVGLYRLYPGAMQPGTLHRGQAYKIGFAKTGYATAYAGAGGTAVSSLADAAAIGAGVSNPANVFVDAVMQPESTITGTVTDGTDPVGGVIVGAFVADTNSLATTTTTAADGTFTLHGLSGIGHRLAFLTPGNTYAPLVLGAGPGNTAVAQGRVVTPPVASAFSVGTVELGVGADCAAAQSGTSSLAGADLHNCDLSYSTMDTFLAPGADLSGADLTGASLASQTLDSATLIGANLTYTNLFGVELMYTDLSGSDLSTAHLERLVSQGLIFDAQTTVPSGWLFVGSSTYATLVGPTAWLYDVDLSGADLSGMDLHDSRWIRVDLTGTDLSGANLTGMDSSGLIFDATTILPDGWSIVGGELVQS